MGGVLLVLVSALGGVLLFSSADDRHSVLVAATDLEIGVPIERGDLRVVELSSSTGVQTLDPSRLDSLVGQVPTGRVPAGTVLNPAMFTMSAPLAAGEMVFGAALDPGEAPLVSVAVGTRVQMLSTPKDAVTVDAGPVDPAAGLAAATAIGDGTVWAVEPLANGQLWLSIRTASDVGLRASKAAQNDELRVVLIGGEPG